MAKRITEHEQQLTSNQINTIDVIVVNLYPFEETINQVESLTGSGFGFYHFFGNTGPAEIFEHWSTKTKKMFLDVPSGGRI